VADATGLLDLSGWPAGMRVIVRKERPHPGAQLRITDPDGMRVTAFATNTARGQLADLELRHRRRARAEDRIRCAKDTGLTNLPLHDFDQNRIWCAIVALACELTAWLQTLALAGHQARRWEPKRLRLRLFSTAGRLAGSGRRVVLHLARTNHWGGLLVAMLTRLRKTAHPRRLTAGSHVPTTLATPGPWNPAPHRATSGNPSHPRGRITQHPAPDTADQAAPADSRKIRARIANSNPSARRGTTVWRISELRFTLSRERAVHHRA
jgi:Transposase DDE domain group 1